MIVLDASAAIELLLGSPRASALAARLTTYSPSLHAPQLLDLEVASVLRRLEMTRAVTPAVAARVIDDLLVLDLNRYPHEILLPRVWQLRRNLTAYDAAYVALAEALEAPLVTFDARLAGASGHRAVIELLG